MAKLIQKTITVKTLAEIRCEVLTETVRDLRNRLKDQERRYTALRDAYQTNLELLEQATDGERFWFEWCLELLTQQNEEK